MVFFQRKAYRFETGSKSNPCELKLMSGEPRDDSPVRMYQNKTSSYADEGVSCNSLETMLKIALDWKHFLIFQSLEDLDDMEARVMRELAEAQARKNAASN